ncbi:MAG: hypothetical protein FGM57_01850 [Candidatus Taylorbacteria bacterium]|nr:hypothetical protein [Candidatus Taylorbacteria bacterium]
MKYVPLLLLLVLPTPTHASEMFISPGEKTRIEEMVDKIIEINTNTSSTSTNNNEAKLDEITGLKIFEEIETSTTTLTIQAPMIKLWQASGGIRSTLKTGMKSNEVVILQGLLSAYIPDFRNTFVSGYFGAKTRDAVKKFQKMYSLPETGTVGAKTREVMNSKYLMDLCPFKNTTPKFFENLDRKTAVAIDYVPGELMVLPKNIRTAGIVCLSKEPADHLSEMVKAAKKAGHELIILSGYRRYEVQKLLKEWGVKNNIEVEEHEAIGLAEAGHSEHQLGSTVDISGKSLSYIGPSTAFGKTPEGIWLQQNSYKYGFIMSYPKGKENITGYIYEPWHFRYIGKDSAEKIFTENMTIQEYLNMTKKTTVQNES